jgi:hypothetical protein
VHVERTAKLAGLLGQAALQNGGVKAYVRVLGSEYQAKDDKTKVSLPYGPVIIDLPVSWCFRKPLSEDNESARPWTRKQKWFHEAGRALANIPRRVCLPLAVLLWIKLILFHLSLNLVLVRPAALYGPYMVTQGEMRRLTKDTLLFF